MKEQWQDRDEEGLRSSFLEKTGDNGAPDLLGSMAKKVEELKGYSKGFRDGLRENLEGLAAWYEANGKRVKSQSIRVIAGASLAGILTASCVPLLSAGRGIDSTVKTVIAPIIQPYSPTPETTKTPTPTSTFTPTPTITVTPTPTETSTPTPIEIIKEYPICTRPEDMKKCPITDEDLYSPEQPFRRFIEASIQNGTIPVKFDQEKVNKQIHPVGGVLGHECRYSYIPNIFKPPFDDPEEYPYKVGFYYGFLQRKGYDYAIIPVAFDSRTKPGEIDVVIGAFALTAYYGHYDPIYIIKDHLKRFMFTILCEPSVKYRKEFMELSLFAYEYKNYPDWYSREARFAEKGDVSGFKDPGMILQID